MIGQINLTNKIDTILNRFPRFSIVCGDINSGRQTIISYICNKLNLAKVVCGLSIEDVRNTIELSYQQKDPIAYIFPNADGMHISAKNSLLKITEEPPRNAYFFLTVNDLDNILDTIKSRGTVFNIEPYTQEDIIQYRNLKKYSEGFDDKLFSICKVPGQVDELFTYDVPSFISFAEGLCNNIHIPRNGNVFKITKKIKVKETDTGFDSVLLFNLVQELFYKKGLQEKKPEYFIACIVTNKYIKQLKQSSISKLGTIDMWLFDVRKALM